MTSIAETFREAGLPAPPIPSRFESSLQDLGPWWFATNDVSPAAMYLFDTDFLLTLLSGQFDDFVAVSHAGHGANSYALSYFLMDWTAGTVPPNRVGRRVHGRRDGGLRLARYWSPR